MDMSQRKVALVAALELEVWPTVRHWAVEEREFSSKRFRFYENERAVLVCGGIGAEAARRATEAIITSFNPVAVVSVGFAGALDPSLRVGTVLYVKQVIDAKDGSRAESPIGSAVLVSSDTISSSKEKNTLREAYDAQAADMEAAAVARGAQAHGITFVCTKAISDEFGFDLPPIEGFIAVNGQFRQTRFILSMIVRPWLWAKVYRLAKNSAKASKALCKWIDQYNHPDERYKPGLQLRVNAR